MGLRAGDALTPALVERAVRLGASVPFAEAADLLALFTGVRVAPDTVRRLTEDAGAAQVARETAVVAELERTVPDGPVGPPLQLLSVDGAMAPLVGGDWAEVRTLAVGVVTGTAAGPTTTALSYFSRLTDAATFAGLATGETHRRGTMTADTVVAVTDGAPWCQSFVDLHRPDAVRVLDFPHAVDHLSRAAQAVFGPGTAAGSDWIGVQAHRLRHGEEDTVLTALTDLAAPAGVSAETRTAVARVRTYLTTRREQIRYQVFVAAGYPIGSGCVESANKLVVEARLKGAGMHWARANVDPLLALRTLLANRRWAAEWPALWRQLCRSGRPSRVPPTSPAPRPRIESSPVVPPPVPSSRPKLVVNGTPTSDHPWKRGFARRAKP